MSAAEARTLSTIGTVGLLSARIPCAPRVIGPATDVIPGPDQPVVVAQPPAAVTFRPHLVTLPEAVAEGLVSCSLAVLRSARHRRRQRLAPRTEGPAGPGPRIRPVRARRVGRREALMGWLLLAGLAVHAGAYLGSIQLHSWAPCRAFGGSGNTGDRMWRSACASSSLPGTISSPPGRWVTSASTNEVAEREQGSPAALILPERSGHIRASASYSRASLALPGLRSWRRGNYEK